MEKYIRKLLAVDVSVLVGFVVFVWVTMCFLGYSILTAIGASQTKNIIIAIGVITLFFATLSLLLLIVHLRRNRQEIYTEEFRHAQPQHEDIPAETVIEATPLAEAKPAHSSGSIFVKIFDILFIMVLCFVTLLAAMLLRGKTENGAGIYTVGMISLLVTVVGFIVYFLFLLIHSDKELKIMVDELYSGEDAETKIEV